MGRVKDLGRAIVVVGTLGGLVYGIYWYATYPGPPLQTYAKELKLAKENKLPAPAAVMVPDNMPFDPNGQKLGFNAARTAFRLPYDLGFLPGPLLAYARQDPEYARGLVTPGKWAWGGSAATEASQNQSYSNVGLFVYGGADGTGNGINTKLSSSQGLYGSVPGWPPLVPIRDFRLHVYTDTAGDPVLMEQPTALEIVAAPTGTLALGRGKTTWGYCVPMSTWAVPRQAVVDYPSTYPDGAPKPDGGMWGPWVRFRTGPATIVGEPVGYTATGPRVYTKGAPSCKGFN